MQAIIANETPYEKYTFILNMLYSYRVISWNSFLKVELMSSLFCLYGVTNSMLSLCTCIVSKQYVVNMVLQTVYCQYVFSMLLIRCQYVVTYSMLSVVGLPLWRSRFVVHQSVDGFCPGWGRLSCLHYILAVPSSVTSLPYHLIMSSSLKPSCNDWKLSF